jgi:uncharacterized damage-inducible protein DinB
MTYYGPRELAASLRTVRNNTIQIAEDIPEAQYSYRATPETRSVAETLVHIAAMGRSQYQLHFIDHRDSMAGFDLLAHIDRLNAEEKQPWSKQQILELLRTEGERMARAVDAVTEEFLAERVEFMPGTPSRSRFDVLASSKEHEMHHRAQLMLMERLLGLTPHLTRQNQERLNTMRAHKAAV